MAGETTPTTTTESVVESRYFKHATPPPAEVKAVATPATVSPPAPTQLEPFKVVAPRIKSDAPKADLPRLKIPPVQDSHVVIDKFDTPAGRDEKLQQKHLSSLDRNVLNRFSLPGATYSATNRARQAEANLQAASLSNEIADQIAAMEAAGASKAEIKEMKKLYEQVISNRPK